jgi:hypothetical protein
LDASADDDSDGMSNYGEFVAYTNPTNDTSKFTIAIVPIDNSASFNSQQPTLMAAVGHRASNITRNASRAFSIRWQSAPGRTYAVYVTDNLAAGWSAEPVAELSGTGEMLEYVPEPGPVTQFFKVSVFLAEGMP